MAYTFKDDGASLTFYREYNKEVNAKNETLVGNWVEERALKDQIGTGRYAMWVNNGDEKSVATAKQQTFTKFTTRPDALDTFSRTLAHSDHTPSAEYSTNNEVKDPGYTKYVNPGVGAREQMLVERARQLAQSENDGSIGELPSNYQSTHRQDYTPLPLPPAESLGRKVAPRCLPSPLRATGPAPRLASAHSHSCSLYYPWLQPLLPMAAASTTLLPYYSTTHGCR